ncbi:uncharacterized protein CANTADRAFT_54915 [Suhomyces tanzawaensis NRRL Y-17324]|uniref:tRNA/rRNA methyltransferase SpoU type domain-containing protein n=1 Tax=Suhomyces tanzawaensis NRRL Y-17324 TaxID=984487 RepID=A0A1E4SF53_9ASCO|nr:uncharacterized protein CANTADRAFT_54915 [Suhomyces tanzawaensis NRRL Y-17324]ODV78144.1 hypothetical protein CANTADRAFT_54915 [Suhomyces tanzawaensis NRRL Y-17324]
MSISISYLTKYLGSEVQVQLATDLSQKLSEDIEHVQALYDLLDVVDLNDHHEIHSAILEYFTDAIYSSESSKYEYAAKYIQKVPRLRQDILSKISKSLHQYISQNINWFIPEFSSILEIQIDRDDSIEISNQEVISLFQFLEYLLTITEKNMEILDPVILMFLGINDETINSLMTQLLRWRIDDITNSIGSFKIWEIIFTLEATGVKSHKSNGFILWLRYLNSPNFVADKTFEEVALKSNYWGVLQNGLSSVSHEHRKFCLSILQLSVQSIKFDISNDYITWNTSESSIHLEEWSRYTTLFEVMGVDTSLHQAVAGSNDIIGLISSNSLIHPSWGFCLLSTGFKATMDSVKKFSLNLLLSIPPEHLYLMKYGLPFLEQIYLPYAMSAHLFIVRNVDGFSKCEFGDRLSNFIASLVSNLRTNDEYELVLGSIMKVLENLKESFDPARIYVTRGIVKGLGDKQVLKFGVHDKILLKLFENTSEGDLFETACQTLNLQILLHFELSETQFIETLDKFVKLNGYKLVNDNLKDIKNYFSGSTNLFESLKRQESDDSKVFLLPFIDDDQLIPYILTESKYFLVKILESGLNLTFLQDDRILEACSELINSDLLIQNEEIISSLSRVQFNSNSVIQADPLKKLWKTIEDELQLDNYHTLTVAVKKFRLFNKLVRFQQFFDSYTTILDLHKSMLSNTLELTKTVKNFYKIKDEIYGEFFTLLETCSNYGLFDQVSIIQVLDLVNANSSDYRSNMAMVKIMQNYIINCEVSNDEYEQIAEFLAAMWDNLDSSRLQLNQKDLHVLFINTLYHSKLLSSTTSSEKVCDRLTHVGLSIIENSQGRRSLLPSLAKALSFFQVNHNQYFESASWLPEILVRSLILFQLRSNVFKLEKIIGTFFDEEISSSESHLYQSIYGPDEVSSKVWILTILSSIKSTKFANQIMQFIIDNEREFYFLQVNKSTDGLEEWTRIQLLSIIISIIDVVDFDDYMESFIKLLETDPSPLARLYVEWIVSYKLLSNEKYTKYIFDSLSNEMITLKPTVITSYERTLVLMIQHLSSSQESDFISKFLTIIIPGATSNKASTRHFSLSLLLSIFEGIKVRGIKLNSHISEMLENMHKSALKSDSFGQYRSGDALLWDIKKDMTLVGISGGVLMRISDREEIEFIPREVYLEYLTPEQIAFLNHPVGEDLKDLWVKERKVQKRATKVPESSAQSPLQTKSGAWNTIMDVDVTARGSDIVRSDLIVVSSLVNKLPNLGGICRLSDVLGAGLLTLNDLNAKTQQQFKSVAVTADQWMPMIEVKVEEIKNFLKEKKREGYTLIGLEQTDKSVELNSELKFPKKSLILLGREKEGVPGDLLSELDMCVEIKQVGVIRSMNIQTATAIIVHAYSSQHC